MRRNRREYDQRRNQTAERKAWSVAYNRDYYRKHGEQRKLARRKAPKVTKPCLICGRPAIVVCPARFERTKYCSPKCRLIGANQKAVASLKANGHAPWSESQRRKMEIQIRRRSERAVAHPKRRVVASGYVFSRNRPGNERGEHRIIAERVLGRELKKSEIVHHLNLDKADNRHTNLVVCTSWLHGYMHLQMQKLWVKEHIHAL